MSDAFLGFILRGLDDRTKRIESKLDALHERITTMGQATEDAITQLNATIAILRTTIDEVIASLQLAADDPAQIAAATAQLEAARDALAAAGTPAAPTP